MIFSVFNDNARCWEYFEAPGTSANYGARGTKYRPLNGRPSGPPRGGLGGGGSGIGPIGFTPESLAMALPSSARPVGHGSEARGVIAVVPKSGIRPAHPAQWDEWQGQGRDPSGVVNGLGAADSAADSAPPVQEEGIPLSKIVFAACVASVVGVIVQKILK